MRVSLAPELLRAPVQRGSSLLTAHVQKLLCQGKAAAPCKIFRLSCLLCCLFCLSDLLLHFSVGLLLAVWQLLPPPPSPQPALPAAGPSRRAFRAASAYSSVPETLQHASGPGLSAEGPQQPFMAETGCNVISAEGPVKPR